VIKEDRMKLLAMVLSLILPQLLIAQTTVVDEIMRDYSKSATFAHFLGKTQGKVLPGDDVFLFRKLKSSPDLLRSKKFPYLVYESGMYTLRHAKTEINFRFSDREKYEFEINGQKIILHPSMFPSVRWLTINDVLSRTKTSFISFMPVAFAQEHGEPTFTNVILFSLTSRLAMDATQGLDIKVDRPDITYLQMMKKAKELQSSCNINFLTEMMRRMASIQAQFIKCEEEPKKGRKDPVINGNVFFEIPFGEGAVRNLKMNYKKQMVEEKSPELQGKILTYKKAFTETNIDFTPGSDREKQKLKSLREKGLEWIPVDGASEEIRERAEQFRELANFAYSADFCTRCGLTIRRAIAELLIDLEMNPKLDQYGNPTDKPTATSSPESKASSSAGSSATPPPASILPPPSPALPPIPPPQPLESR
jgi:hypothetical protein